MNQFTAAVVQLSSTDDPEKNLPVTEAFIREAKARGADLIATPEVTNIVSMSRTRQRAHLQREEDDRTLHRLRAVADELGVWLLIGSLALKSGDPDGRFANRSFLIGPGGEIAARYDKIHMFDARPRQGEHYRESAGYRPGKTAEIARTQLGPIGLTICYDLRFPELYQRLARSGAMILTAPSAFTCPTGAAHWEVLIRARAIETGGYLIAPAQCGTHEASEGPARQTWGRSLIVSPWGEVLADGGDEPGVSIAAIDLDACREARRKVPNLIGAQVFTGPEVA